MWFRRRAAGLPDGWEDLVRRHVKVWRYLDDDERDALADRADVLLHRWRWEAARGFEITDRMRVVIAMQAALLVLGLDVDQFDRVSTVIVHPTTMRVERTETGPGGIESCGAVDLLGEAHDDGPVLIAWDSASTAARHPERGHDVTLHEFAHQIDMADRTVDGTPSLAPGPFADRWIEVNTAVFEQLVHHGDPVIDDYAATDPGEFFAVVTEQVFTTPTRVAEVHPDLVDLYGSFYRQDLLERAARRPRID